MTTLVVRTSSMLALLTRMGKTCRHMYSIPRRNDDSNGVNVLMLPGPLAEPSTEFDMDRHLQKLSGRNGIWYMMLITCALIAPTASCVFASVCACEPVLFVPSRRWCRHHFY
nr:hypothetical protein CFP56_22348 [Quercus suber]